MHAIGRERPLATAAMATYRLALGSLAALVTGPIVVWLACAAVVTLGLPVYLFVPRLGFLAAKFLAAMFQMAFLETLRDNMLLCFLILPSVAMAIRKHAPDRPLAMALTGGIAAVFLALHGGGGGGTALASGFGGLAAGHAYALATSRVNA